MSIYHANQRLFLAVPFGYCVHSCSLDSLPSRIGGRAPIAQMQHFSPPLSITAIEIPYSACGCISSVSVRKCQIGEDTWAAKWRDQWKSAKMVITGSFLARSIESLVLGPELQFLEGRSASSMSILQYYRGKETRVSSGENSGKRHGYELTRAFYA